MYCNKSWVNWSLSLNISHCTFTLNLKEALHGFPLAKLGGQPLLFFLHEATAK